KFSFITEGMDVAEYISMLKDLPVKRAVEEIVGASELWRFLDEYKPAPAVQLWSDHEDEVRDPERGYGNARKPEDYISGFKTFLEENANKITALKLIRTKPTDLDRKSLKELAMVL